MKKEKRAIRRRFRAVCLARDKEACCICGFKPSDPDILDVHHIIDRHEMPNGGYVLENGITLCPVCHKSAEEGMPDAGALFIAINSNEQAARAASERLSQ